MPFFYNKTLGKPFSMSKFQRTFKNMLEEIGISKQEQVQRNITFHSLRHNFVTLGRLAGVSDFEMQTLAGHKSGAMMDHYSHGKQAINLEILGQKLGNNLSRQINHDLLFANV
ncbi:hypothetical protein AGMMS50212_15810 [Spirochaetia bacterium]|nr:hypothetical protein AGMMS50212_15810 [Spirochaetia bacterium]